MPVSRTTILGFAMALASVAPLAAQSDTPSHREALLAADRAAADSAMAHGFAAALALGAEDLVLVYPGAPVLSGREAILRVLSGQQALSALTIRWVPLYGEVSGDGMTGVTWGVTAVSGGGGAPLRFCKYLSAWRYEGGTWRMVARSDVGLLPGAAWKAPEGFTSPTLAPLARSGPAAEFARADIAFAALAARRGAPAAFAAFAAEDAVTFAGTGELNRGAAEIRLWLGDDTSRWEWHPVTGGGAPDLGFTVGEAVITPPDGPPSYSKYLTLWRRAGGQTRYVADGGNARPAPQTP